MSLAPPDICRGRSDQPGPGDVEPKGESGTDELAEGEEEGTSYDESGDRN
jgi:hypothetical protein